MLGITSNCRVVLRMVRQHLCMSIESEGGFSPGYILLSFQNLTPSSRQEHYWLPRVYTGENLPYKGGCQKIGSDRRGGMNQNTLNPGLDLRWPNPWGSIHEWGREATLRTTLNHVGTGHQVWLPIRDGDEKSNLLAVTLWLTSEESAWQRFWRGQRKTTDSEHNQVRETRGY